MRCVSWFYSKDHKTLAVVGDETHLGQHLLRPIDVELNFVLVSFFESFRLLILC
jgi:hypothetical protein